MAPASSYKILPYHSSDFMGQDFIRKVCTSLASILLLSALVIIGHFIGEGSYMGLEVEFFVYGKY